MVAILVKGLHVVTIGIQEATKATGAIMATGAITAIEVIMETGPIVETVPMEIALTVEAVTMLVNVQDVHGVIREAEIPEMTGEIKATVLIAAIMAIEAKDLQEAQAGVVTGLKATDLVATGHIAVTTQVSVDFREKAIIVRDHFKNQEDIKEENHNVVAVRLIETHRTLDTCGRNILHPSI